MFLENGKINISSKVFDIPAFKQHTYKYGLYSNLHDHNTTVLYKGPKMVFQGGSNFKLVHGKKEETMHGLFKRAIGIFI